MIAFRWPVRHEISRSTFRYGHDARSHPAADDLSVANSQHTENLRPKGTPSTTRLAGVFTTLINSAAIAAEMALLKPPDLRPVESGSRRPSAPTGGEVPTRTGGEGRMRTIGGNR